MKFINLDMPMDNAKLDLRKMDLNLLLTLKTLLETRSTSIAADQLGRSQSAISHALNRLRHMFDDKLFVREGWDLKPTPRALALEQRLISVIGNIETLLEEPDGFEPIKSKRDFRLAAPNFCIPFFTSIMDEIATYAPKISISFEPVGAASTDQLLSGALDAILAPSTPKNRSGIVETKIATFQWAVFNSHTRQYDKWTFEDWLSARHIQVSVSSQGAGTPVAYGRSPVDDALTSQNLTRHVAVRVPDFQSAFAFAAHSELIFTAPYIDKMQTPFGLKKSTCPINLPTIPISLFTRDQTINEAGNIWLKKLIGRVFDI